METTNDGGAPAPDVLTPAPATERGAKSPYLTKAEGGVLDTGEGGYQPLTEGAPEKGLYTLVGGYLDDDGVVHTEVELRSMSGHEEDLLGNRSVPITQRMSGIMASCVKRIGTITDRGQISKAVNGLPTGSRSHLLVSLRRTTHWKRTKDIYDMDARCPRQQCEKIGSYKVHLGELDTWDIPEPTKRLYDVKLEDAGKSVTWKIPTGAEDQVLAVVAEEPGSDAEILTYMIMVRLTAVDGERVELGVSDFLDRNHTKIKLSHAAQKIRMMVKNLSVGDREDLRTSFIEHEPGIDTDLDFKCKFCHRPFKGMLSVTQESFFFPSATSRSSKRKSST